MSNSKRPWPAEHPLLMTPYLVGRTIQGFKTQTRRITGLKKVNERPDDYYSVLHSKGVGFKKIVCDEHVIPLKCPYGKPGDVLWVRETHAIVPKTAYGNNVPSTAVDNHNVCVYKSGWVRSKPGKWRPSIYMPKAAARLWLLLKDVRVERLQDISEEDAIKEGIKMVDYYKWLDYTAGADQNSCYLQPLGSFKTLIQSINGEGIWDKNPWVWVLDFEVLSTIGVEQAIEQYKKAGDYVG